MTDAELQEEEREVLLSIYEGDENFKQIDKNVFQYKVGFHFFSVFLQRTTSSVCVLKQIRINLSHRNSSFHKILVLLHFLKDVC